MNFYLIFILNLSFFLLFLLFQFLYLQKKKVRERMLRLCSKYNARISSFIIVLFPLSFMSLHFCMNQLKFVARAWSVIIILHNEIILLNRIRFRLYSGLVRLSFFFFRHCVEKYGFHCHLHISLSESRLIYNKLLFFKFLDFFFSLSSLFEQLHLCLKLWICWK